MARGYLRWSIKELAEKSGVNPRTIKRMEEHEGFPDAHGKNILVVYETLSEAGIVFLPEDGGGVGVRVRKPLEMPTGKRSDSEKGATRRSGKKAMAMIDMPDAIRA